MNFSIKLSLFLLSVIVLSACTSSSLIRPGDSLEVAFDKAMDQYERERFGDAARAFETVISVGRGTDIGQRSQFLLAESYYKDRQFIVAASEFQRYHSFFPRSERAAEALFMEGHSYYRLSPRFNLDQSDSYRAIETFQLFLSRHPSSDKASEAADYIDELRDKLARKQFEAGEQYLRLRHFEAAAIYYGLVVERFPETKWAEMALANQINAYNLYAENSVEARMAERFQKAIDSYETYIQLFPRGENREDAEAFYDRAQQGFSRASQQAQN